MIPAWFGNLRFQGNTENGELTTLGRGGSDITAVAVAAALKLDQATIYTDVPAVKTADPKLVKNALPIYKLNYQEILEMAVEGVRVIHPRAVERAMADDVRLIITSLANGESPPTEIGPKHGIPRREGDTIRAITYMAGITQFKVQMEPEKLSSLLETLAQRASLDLIFLSDEIHSFTVPADADIVEAIVRESGAESLRRDRCSRISLIGSGIRGISGVMTRIYKPLTERKIPVYHTADSYTQIALLIPQANLEEAVNCLHSVFFEGG